MAEQRIAGLKGVAAVLGCVPETVIALASRPWDPLPLRRLEGGVWMLESYIVQWKARQDDLDTWRRRRPRGLPGLPILQGWEGIAEHIGAGVSIWTARAWARDPEHPCAAPSRSGRKHDARRPRLPVLGVDHPHERIIGADGQARVWTYQGALRDWLQARDTAYRTGEARPREKEPERQLSLF